MVRNVRRQAIKEEVKAEEGGGRRQVTYPPSKRDRIHIM
jgi:hypothetical protein